MYIKKIFLLSFHLVQFLSFSQSIIICDEDSKEPIPFANVSLYKENKIINGNYCNQIGVLNIENLLSYEKIEFSCIGYESKFILNFPKICDTVFLTKKNILLDEIKISIGKVKIVSIGFCDEKKKISLSANKGLEIVVFIDNKFGKIKNINSLLFKIKRREDYKTAIRVHFYKKLNDKTEPGEEMLTEDIICYFDGKTKGLIEVNVFDKGLELPLEGAFVGIEWLGLLDEKTGKFMNSDEKNWSDTSIELNDAINQPLTFTRNFKTSIWSNTEKLKKEFETIIKYKNYPNASFGIKVYNE